MIAPFLVTISTANRFLIAMSCETPSLSLAMTVDSIETRNSGKKLSCADDSEIAIANISQ
jgi:hypothetical protein